MWQWRIPVTWWIYVQDMRQIACFFPHMNTGKPRGMRLADSRSPPAWQHHECQSFACVHFLKRIFQRECNLISLAPTLCSAFTTFLCTNSDRRRDSIAGNSSLWQMKKMVWRNFLFFSFLCQISVILCLEGCLFVSYKWKSPWKNHHVQC